MSSAFSQKVVCVSSFSSPTKDREYLQLKWWQRKVYQCLLVNNCCRHGGAGACRCLKKFGSIGAYTGPVWGGERGAATAPFGALHWQLVVTRYKGQRNVSLFGISFDFTNGKTMTQFLNFHVWMDDNFDYDRGLKSAQKISLARECNHWIFCQHSNRTDRTQTKIKYTKDNDFNCSSYIESASHVPSFLESSILENRKERCEWWVFGAFLFCCFFCVIGFFSSLSFSCLAFAPFRCFH